MTRNREALKRLLLRGFLVSPRLIVAALFLTTSPAPAQESEAPLTNCAQVLALSAKCALLGVSVTVTGVVTAAEPNWGGRFFVQDGTGGVFVESLIAEQPAPGDLVEVSGISHPGAFAPIITKPRWAKVGTAPLPGAKVVPIEQMMAGIEDGQRIEISGIVRTVAVEPTRLDIILASGGYRLRLYMPIPPGTNPQSLVGATVHVRGTPAASFNPELAELRHLITVVLFVPQVADFIVEKRESNDPFAEPVLQLNDIAQYRKDSAPGKRVHVRGTVTYQRRGQDLFLKDGSGGLHVSSHQPELFVAGETVDAVGFASLENFLPVLQDAVCRSAAEPVKPVVAEPVALEKLQAGLHHADFIAVHGNLLDRHLRLARQPTSGKMWVKTVLLLQSQNLYFTAEAETPDEDTQLASIPIGSLVEVSGVCLTEIGDDGKFKSMQVLLPSPESVRIVKTPGWLTARHLAIALGIFFLVSVVAISWIIMISRKNSELNALVGEKEKAKIELQNAHDQLEARVKERTEQLKIQIAARKESELQFKGGLAERTRLAQELHDTLEQSLASIALQLDTSAKLFRKDTEAASYHFEMARNILSQSQVDVRRSVWDLRSRALEQFDLRTALITSSKQITDGTRIKVEVKTSGRVRPLPEIIEDNLLRIAQEALTNIIKHSGATRAGINLDYRPQTVVLQIQDNGRGFEKETCLGPRDGHFGLLGISERAQRLRGEIALTSAPGSGTTVRVEIPMEPAQEGPGRPADDMEPNFFTNHQQSGDHVPGTAPTK